MGSQGMHTVLMYKKLRIKATQELEMVNDIEKDFIKQLQWCG
jgi:hypothetical protein